MIKKNIKPIVTNDITESDQFTTESTTTYKPIRSTNYKSASIVYAPNGYDYNRNQRPTALRHDRSSVGAIDTNDQDSGSDSAYGNDMLYYAESRNNNDGDQSSHGQNNQFAADPNADFVILK